MRSMRKALRPVLADLLGMRSTIADDRTKNGARGDESPRSENASGRYRKGEKT